MRFRPAILTGGLAAAFLVFCLTTASTQSTTLAEGFEAGGKTAYAAANVTLGSGSWHLSEALIGNLSTDRKTGTYSARLRETGFVRMNFNVASAGTVSAQHAKFGTDANSSWELWKSTDGGGSWTKVGSTVSTASTTLQTASFTVDSSVATRFEFRKVSGGAARLNLDDIQITAFSSPTPTPTPPPASSVHLTMGNPSGAVADPAVPDNYLMIKAQYALAYHRDRGTPVWTSWHLDPSWLGTTPRQDDFRADTTLPAGWYRVLGTDYSGSGYDRGHMTPSADRTLTVADNSSTFLMTNMIPQLPANNQGPWATLESYCRTLVNSGNELYIVSGGYGVQGTIAGGNVVVPTQTWKVIVVLPQGTGDVSRVTTSTRTIAVVMPNSGTINSDWRTYRVNVDQVEAMTGFDFFSNVSDSVETFIEGLVDNQ
ncbi:MAG: DNA/RNA non-specific endonuclease [Acidobacteria bacterium]|nr:DNA/RNA non-specific endonuclease [Acidobacteriota bacterium]